MVLATVLVYTRNELGKNSERVKKIFGTNFKKSKELELGRKLIGCSEVSEKS